MSDAKDKNHVTDTPDVSYIKNVEVAHEASDVYIAGITRFVVALFVLTVAVYVMMWGLFRAFESRVKEPPPSPMALSDKERLPPEPRLQGAPAFAETLERAKKQEQSEERSATAGEGLQKPRDPQWEIKALREQWNDVLEHGPMDEHGNRYGMPIERAKEEILKQGLPVREQKAVGSRQ